jgi:hypothetical protein
MYIKIQSIYFFLFTCIFLTLPNSLFSKVLLHSEDTVVDSSICISHTSFCLRDSVIKEAQKFIGVPYKYGGTTGNGFDCSGFTAHVFSYFSISLPHSANEQSLMGNLVALNECAKGDLIFFKGRSSRLPKVGHVGIITEKKDSVITFIHASTHSGVTISSLDESYYNKRYLGIRKLINDSLIFPS